MSEELEKKQTDDKIIFGFWVYLMTDLLMFAVLFATFAVLRGNTFGGPEEKELIDLNFVLVETLILLTSSFTVGLAMISAHKKSIKGVLGFLFLTFVLGATFLGMELYEFNHLLEEGHSWQSSASLSSFFALVGTHGLHITLGLLWLVVISFYLVKRGFTKTVSTQLSLFSLFWHFLDIVWIFIFTIVYLMGAVL